MNQKSLGIAKKIVLTSAAFLTMVYGFNCSQTGFVTKNTNGGLGVYNVSSEDGADFGVGLLTSEQILKTMVSVTGIGLATDQSDPHDVEIMRTYSSRAASLPAGRGLDLINGPMMVTVTSLAGAVCAKVVAHESAVPDSSAAGRRFFNQLAFSQGVNSVSSSALNDAAARMARAFWSREITDEEVAIINSIMLGEFRSGAADTVAETQNLALGLCAGMLSSFDTLVY